MVTILSPSCDHKLHHRAGPVSILRNGHTVVVFTDGVPEETIVETVLRDVAVREGITHRNLHILLSRLHGRKLRGIGRDLGLPGG